MDMVIVTSQRMLEFGVTYSSIYAVTWKKVKEEEKRDLLLSKM